MFNRPLLSQIVFFALIATVIIFISIEVIYYFFEGRVEQFIENEYVRYLHWALAVTAALLGIIGFLRTVFPQKSSAESSAKPTTRSLLLRLLDRVEEHWVNGVLNNSVHHAALLELNKEFQPFQVASPWQMTLELPNQATRLLAADRTVDQVFEHEATRLLLILGEPGAGKTTTLLQLARQLIERARADKERPIPVVFNLSSWAVERLPLPEWLASELSVKYQIPKELGAVWLRNHWLLPLLDGLDEVQAGARQECVAAINAFIPTAGTTGLVVCCRRQEYEQLATHLQLHAAICLQPLRPEQIEQYVAAGGAKLAGLQALLKADAAMRELAESPLLLSIMSLAYQDVPATEIETTAATDRRAQLFDRYIAKMFARRPNETKQYAQEKTVQRLAWLAAQMQQRGQSEFLVERLQPDWMPSSLGYQLLKMITHDSSYILTAGVVVVLSASINGSEIKTMETLGWSWERFQRNWKNVLLAGLFIGLVGGLFGLLGVLLGVSGLFGLFIGLLFGLPLILLKAGLENQIPVKKSVVNQGIVASFHNMLYFGTPFGIIMGVVLGIGMVTAGFREVSVASFPLWLFIGVFFGYLALGGLAVVQHFILRLTLWLAGYTPFNLVHFLDHAANLILLRKAGGGYMFIHRLILEHFATKWLKKS